jgi:hypothetical protein
MFPGNIMLHIFTFFQNENASKNFPALTFYQNGNETFVNVLVSKILGSTSNKGFIFVCSLELEIEF